MKRKRRALVPRGSKFILLYFAMLDSDAFRELSGNAVKLLVRLTMRSIGPPNGTISMSVREGAKEVDCSRNNAAKCFLELQNAGFIRATQKGAFSWKKRTATTWRLTWLECDDQPATKEFTRHDRGKRELVNGRMIASPGAAERNTQ
jgi:hypothetical protein